MDQLDFVIDVANGKLLAHEVPFEWLVPLAANTDGEKPAPMLERWVLLFDDELDLVRRARNNIDWHEPISDENVAAAMLIAERLLQLAKDARR